MAEIPSGTKFLGVGSSVPTPELSGTAINNKTQYYTIEDLQGLIRPYKVYSALLTQSGTDAPVATVLENTLGDIVWSYDENGVYSANSVNKFIENKTIVFLGSLGDSDLTSAYTSRSFFVDSNKITISSFVNDAIPTTSNSLLLNTPIEIRVYN